MEVWLNILNQCLRLLNTKQEYLRKYLEQKEQSRQQKRTVGQRMQRNRQCKESWNFINRLRSINEQLMNYIWNKHKKSCTVSNYIDKT